MIVDYSTKDFNQVCVRWGDLKPKTFPSQGAYPDYITTGKEMEDHCYSITGNVKLGSEGMVVSAGTQPTGSDEVMFCGFSGC